MGSPTTTDDQNPLRPMLLTVASWALPGAGYWLLGDKARGMVVGGAIGLCFWLGVLIGGVGNVIDLKTMQLWYVAQVFCGAHLLLAELIGLAANRPTGSESIDIGTAFTGIAGLLNLIAATDVLTRAFPEDTPPTN